MIFPAIAALRARAIFAKWWPALVGAAVVFAPAFMLGQCDGARRQKVADAAELAAARSAALERDAGAKETAGAERVNDTAAVTTLEKDLSDAVAPLPDAKPSDRRVALGCARLRAQGTDVSRIPACRGPAAGAEAAPGPGGARK